MDSAAIAELEQLQQRAMAWQVVAHADQAAADQVTQEGTQQALGNLSVSQSSAGQPGPEQQHLMQVGVPSPGRSRRLVANVISASWLIVLFAPMPVTMLLQTLSTRNQGFMLESRCIRLARCDADLLSFPLHLKPSAECLFAAGPRQLAVLCRGGQTACQDCAAAAPAAEHASQAVHAGPGAQPSASPQHQPQGSQERGAEGHLCKALQLEVKECLGALRLGAGWVGAAAKHPVQGTLLH